MEEHNPPQALDFPQQRAAAGGVKEDKASSNDDTSAVVDRAEDPTTQLQEEDIKMEADLTQGAEDEPFTSLFVNIQGDYAVSEENQYKVKQILQREEVKKAIEYGMNFGKELNKIAQS